MDNTNKKPENLLTNLCELHLRRGIYTDGKHITTDIIEILKHCDDIKININYLDPEYQPGDTETPFEGITMLDVNEMVHPNFNYLADHNQIFEGTIEKFALNIRMALVKYWESVLKPGEKYIVFHSAGFDSRIVSLTLMEFRIKHGDTLTKNIHFRCHQPEGPMFIEIMEKQGWPKNQYSVYEGPKEDYYNVGLKDLPLNGWQNYNQTMNFWSDIVPPNKEKEYNLITGAGGELFKMISKLKQSNPNLNNSMEALSRVKGAPRCKNNHLNILFNYYPFNGAWEGYQQRIFKNIYMPFFSYLYLFFSLRVNPAHCEFDGERDTIRMEIVKSFIKSHHIDCFNITYGRHDYTWNISEARKKQMKIDFYESYFYNDYKEHLPNDINFIDNMYGWAAKIWGLMTVYDYMKKPCEHDLIDITTREDTGPMFLCTKCTKNINGKDL